MPSDHICPDCGRKFASGAALGGHRRVHTKGRLTKDKGYKPTKKRRPAPISTNNHNHSKEYRASPEPYSEQKFYGQYVTDISSEEDDDTQNNEMYWNSNEFMAMPPPIKKRKLNDSMNNGSGPTSIGYVIKGPQNLKKPTKMDAIREQIGLAMALYHFNAAKLAEYADIPKALFIKWLQGGIDQKRDIGVNATANSNNNTNHNNKAPKKTPIFKIKIKRSKLKTNRFTEKAYYLTPILADQIAEKMQKWLDDFIRFGFMDKKYLEFVHHYKRYKRNTKYNPQNEAHSFDNADMKWNKIMHASKEFMEKRNNNPMFDWNDDSSFYYKVNPAIEEAFDDLIPIQIEQIVKGKPYKDSFLWHPQHDTQLLVQFIQSLCNDLKEGHNAKLKKSILTSAEKQIKHVEKIRNEYSIALHSFGNKITKRAHNYLQHLKKKSISVNDTMNLMNNITDICHGHILIKLRITHGKVRLVDEFLWNLNDSENDNKGTIEAFAKTLCADQGLPFVFSTSVAVSIRQQINAYKVKMTKSMNQNGNSLNTINDPLSHESLRFVGRQKETGLRNLKMWEPKILVHKPPNRMKTKLRDQ